MASNDSNPKSISIQLTKGFVAIVDEQDSDLATFNWYASNSKDEYAYAARKVPLGDGRYKMEFMHCVILERMLNRPLVKGEKCDHVHHNPRDNRRSELRLASTAENGANRKISITSTSGFKGVSLYSEGRWQSYIRVNGKHLFLGLYGTPEEAYAAYCIEARKQFGVFAHLPDADKVAGIVPVRITRPKTYKPRRRD